LNGDLLFMYTPTTNGTVEHTYVRGKRIASKTLPQQKTGVGDRLLTNQGRL
jgi:hypothetical protein